MPFRGEDEFTSQIKQCLQAVRNDEIPEAIDALAQAAKIGSSEPSGINPDQASHIAINLVLAAFKLNVKAFSQAPVSSQLISLLKPQQEMLGMALGFVNDQLLRMQATQN